MKKYKVEVTITKEYEVEVDENIINEDFRKEFEQYMWTLDDEDTQEAFAKALAEQSARLGVNEFIEGFGRCAQSKEDADLWNARDYNKDRKCTEGLYIYEASEYVESEAEKVESFD